MPITYHFASAQDLNTDILDAIKATFKSKPITITIEESDGDAELSTDMKAILDARLRADESTYLNKDESLKAINKKHGI